MKLAIVALSLFAAVYHQAPVADWPAAVTAKKLYAKNDLRGKAAPKLEVEQWLTGKAPDTKKKVVVLDFWATWCPPCRATIPDMNKLAEKFKDDVVVIGVSNESADKVTEFMKNTKMAYNVAVDPKDRMAKIVGVQGIPHVLVISPDGIVRWQGFPLDDADPLSEGIVAKIVAASKASAH